MSDAVELMEFWPVDADENIGFVAADSDFQLWLLDGIGISFDDISYSVIDGPDDSGIYELVLDYEDYTTLNELYASYLGDNEYASEEGSSPIMDPMDFGEPVNWTPLDGTPSLKRRKDAEDEPLFKTQKEMDEYKQWKKESKEKFPKGEVRVVGRDKIDKRSALGKMMSRWDAEEDEELDLVRDYAYLGPIDLLDEEKLFTPPGPSSDDEDARDEWNHSMWACLHDWQDDKLEITGKGYDRSYDITAYCPTCNTTALIADIHYDSQDMTETFFLPGKLSAIDFQDTSPPIAKFNAEGANPSGGATGDQIISWEHNGLSSPSGPPSDIMWAECAAGKEYVQIFDTTITKNGIEVKLHKAGIKPIEVFVITKDTFGVYLQPWDVTAFSKEFNKKDWNGLFEFEAETFDAHSLHRFTQKDSRPIDIGVTRQKIKKEMFSEISSFMTLKNLAVLTAAGMAGYLIAGRK